MGLLYMRSLHRNFWRTLASCLAVCTLLALSPMSLTFAQTEAVAIERTATAPTPDEIEARIRIEVARQLALAEENRWQTGITPNGGGAFIQSPDRKTTLRLYGYAQSVLTVTDSSNRLPIGESDFRITRTRLDFLFDVDRYRLFIELEGASNPGAALVEAYGQAAYVRDRHYIRFGKYVSPFSTENLRTSRGIPLVQRFIALNSLFALPAVDTQFGPMFFGSFGAKERLKYQVGIFNGNASAGAQTINGFGGNARDNNSSKEVQVRLDYKVNDELTIGTALDIDREPAQMLQLASLSGAGLLAVPVRGKRLGMDMDAHWSRGRVALDTEWLMAKFPDNPNNQNREVSLRGGYMQYSQWLSGSESGGVQGLIRAETAELTGAGVAGINGDRISALTLGTNIWFHGSTRLQLNAIGEYVNGSGNLALRGGSRLRPTLLAELQVKF
jgi:hypothetical protein